MTITIHTGCPERLLQLVKDKEYTPDYMLLDNVFPEAKHCLHPKLQVEYVDDTIDYISHRYKEHQQEAIVTNSDHIINAFRVAKKEGKIDDVIILFYPFNSKEVVEITVDKDGRIAKWLPDFMDTWENMLLRLI